MLKIIVESLLPDAGGRRRVVASMSITPAVAAGGDHAVTVIEAEDPIAGEPPRMCSYTISEPDGGGIWPLVRAAIDAMADAECAQL